MKNLYLSACLFLLSLSGTAQFTLKVTVIDEEERVVLPGATVNLRPLDQSMATDVEGMAVFTNLPSGNYTLQVRYIGYEAYSRNLNIDENLEIEVALEHDHEAMEEVVIRSTRSTRTIAALPTRVEFIGGEEMQEKVNMRPGDIRFVLNESTGIMTQITSPLSANASIRIQGLDGRYTQIQKDGFPLYSGAASGLGLLQIPPLDLKQVEVIKGSSSTLYGGGAIAGMVNLISRTPEEEEEFEVLLNGTSGNGQDVSAFYANSFGKMGLTTYAAFNRNSAYDPSEIGLTAIPEFSRFTFNPRLFFNASEGSRFMFGVNTSIEDRTGGQLSHFEEDNAGSYFERNTSERVSTQFSYDKTFRNEGALTFKNSVNYFNRGLSTPIYRFDGNQLSSFSELNYRKANPKAEWIVGANFWSEDFEETPRGQGLDRSFSLNTVGIFGQNIWDVSEDFSLETGFRLDAVQDYGLAALPRVSLFWHPMASKFSTRLGGGLGYKAPTLFTEETERLQYQYIQPLDPERLQLERSYGVNWDIDYKTELGEDWGLTINQLFFYTRIDHPLMLEPTGVFGLAQPDFMLVNGTGFLDTRGWETNANLSYDHFRWVLGYTYTDARVVENGLSRVNPLTPKSRINSVIMYEKHGEGRIGFESYYYSPQTLSDGSTGEAYWLLGVMAEKTFGKLSVFLNFENFLDTRQTRFDTIFTGSAQQPQFRDIYAPLEGFIMNGGVKIKLLGHEDH